MNFRNKSPDATDQSHAQLLEAAEAVVEASDTGAPITLIERLSKAIEALRAAIRLAQPAELASGHNTDHTGK